VASLSSKIEKCIASREITSELERARCAGLRNALLSASFVRAGKRRKSPTKRPVRTFTERENDRSRPASRDRLPLRSRFR